MSRGFVKNKKLLANYIDFCTMLRLKELREKKGISQLKLALDLNMNQNTISRYETGQREADYRTLIMLADYFNVSIDYLLGHSNSQKLQESQQLELENER